MSAMNSVSSKETDFTTLLETHDPGDVCYEQCLQACNTECKIKRAWHQWKMVAQPTCRHANRDYNNYREAEWLGEVLVWFSDLILFK